MSRTAPLTSKRCILYIYSTFSFDIPILKLAMRQHVVLCVLSFTWRVPDCACHSLCCWHRQF